MTTFTQCQLVGLIWTYSAFVLVVLCGSRQLQQVGLTIDQFCCDYHSQEGWVIVTISLPYRLPWEQVDGTNTNQS